MQIFGKEINGKRLVGEPELFSLEERIFNTVCIIAFVTMCFEVPFNLIIGLMVPASLCIFGVFFSAYLYYLSRFKRKSSIGIQLFCFVCNLLFVVNYFFNSGIFGPNLLLFLLALFLVVTIIPKNQFKIWVTLNLISVFTLLVLEYLYPELAKNVYDSNLSKAIDFAITYFVAVLLIYFTINYIRKNYDTEKKAVLDRNIAIENQKLELERLNSEKDKLFSIVTHDLRTPLNSIQSYLELLSMSELDEDERKILKKRLLEITKDTSAMLTNVLSWSKTQMEGTHAELISLKVKNALISGLSIERNLSLKKGVNFEIACDDDLAIIADKNMFELVLRNLVNNAIKFTSSGGLVRISATKKDSECHIVVKDNGLGIDPKQQEKLFQLKAASTYGTNNERGVGVGLLLCKEFTDLQGGKIGFESKLGEGSSFYLSFKLS
ncbi:HAMP domain-containing sensor histidine kinase [Pedobacter sp. Du54]|uniref:sensor histidine kinase n=1 Tax=Pedobacter anseongensis TaxID=3133439 RepID=UPI0030B16BBA